MSATGGIEQVAEILNTTSRSAERSIIDDIRGRDESLASSIKGLMFVFDDLVHIEGSDLQKVLMEVEQSDLALALKAASGELREKVMRNVSERVAESLQEEIELLGRVRVSDVDEAQHRILEKAQELEAQEEIVLSRNAEETMIQ
jgi:flagellar motor switch protein FliG